MKLIFFLIAFCLISIRCYFSWEGHDRHKRGIAESDMVIKSPDFYEEIKYAGKFKLNPDESGFSHISQGGYFKFRKNDVIVQAESDIRGEVEYKITNDGHSLPMNEEAKALLATAVKEMIYWGFDAEGRMDRLYQNGGTAALFREMDSMRSDQNKAMYLTRILIADSSVNDDMPLILKKIGSLGNDQDKMLLLGNISLKQMNDSAVLKAYFNIIAGLNADEDKMRALKKIINVDTANAGNVLLVSRTLGSDRDRSELYQQMISKGLIKGAVVDILISYISEMGSDTDKEKLYRNLTTSGNFSDAQWISMISSVHLLGSDADKAGLLTAFAAKMPRTEPIRTAYLIAAKSIGNDMEYGKTVRAVQ